MEIPEPDKLSGLAGLFGVLIGGATSIATTWITTTSERKQARLEAQTQFRKEIYADFMNELAAMYAHALKNESINYDLLANAYAVRGRITLASSDAVVSAADKALKFIVDLSMSDQKSDRQIRSMMDENEMDVIGDFATACRAELSGMR